MANVRKTSKVQKKQSKPEINFQEALLPCGKVSYVSGLAIVVSNLSLALGEVCRIIINKDHSILAEVIGFDQDDIKIMPFENFVGISKGMLVVPQKDYTDIKVGEGILGRVIDALGRPLDDVGDLKLKENYPLFSTPLNPLKRNRIKDPLDVGVRVINSMITTCKGQRMGIFAESGIGKSVLLGMMTRFTEADIVVVGLIGERGREVKEFIEEILGTEGIKKSVVIATPADSTPLMKIRGADYANAVAEYFRDQDKNVLLILDSLTRYAQAYRELTLSAGELPTAKGYTPTVFAKLSQLIERSGNGIGGDGSITAYYTVLIDDENFNDPVGEHVRSLIDGHIILSRELAEAGHYPAIDIEKSISRLMNNIVSEEHSKYALIIKKLYSAYRNNQDMINIGMYQAGSDALVDLAIKFWKDIEAFLTQGINEQVKFDESLNQLQAMIRQMQEQQ